MTPSPQKIESPDTPVESVARELGMTFALAKAVNDDPVFLDMMADVVLDTIRRRATGRPRRSARCRKTE